jgi:thiamine biosynthesis lipoprotein
MIAGKEIYPVFNDPGLIRHAVDAMKTTFRIFVADSSPRVVDPAVSEAFQKLEELENLLSRYIPGSDVSRINALKSGESLFLSDDCDACLRLALEAFTLTGGLFDPCAGALVDTVKAGSKGEVLFSGCIVLDPERPLVSCIEPGRVVDLGGIGKGFALERMAAVLALHGVEDALLTSGASTILAMGGKSWPIEIPHSTGTRRIQLCQTALGASGNTQQGVHIVDPIARCGAARHGGVWVEHTRAPFADAFSTACFVMTPEQISEFATELGGECRIISDPDWEV